MEKEIAFSIGGGIHSSKKRYFAQKDCVETPYNKPIRARIRVLDTLLGEIVYTSESVYEHNYIALAFSQDERFLYVYESKRICVTMISTTDWTVEREIVLEELSEAQRAYTGVILALGDGFCVTFTNKPEKGVRRQWHALTYDLVTGEKRIFQNVEDGEGARELPGVGVVFERSPRLLDGEKSRFALLDANGHYTEYSCAVKTPMLCADGLYYFEDYQEKRKDFSFHLWRQPWGESPQAVCAFSLPFQPFPYMRKIEEGYLLVGDVYAYALLSLDGQILYLESAGDWFAPDVSEGVIARGMLYLRYGSKLVVRAIEDLKAQGAVNWGQIAQLEERERLAEEERKARESRVLPNAKVLKKPISLFVPSEDGRYWIGLTDRGRLYVLNTETDEFVFETRTYPATSACFSKDGGLLYVYDSQKRELRIFSVKDWTLLSTECVERLKKADKDNWGTIYPTENGYCIDFCDKPVGEHLDWHTYFYNTKTGEESVLKNEPHLKKDRGRYVLKWKKEGDEYALTDGGKVVLRMENYVFDAIMVNGKIYLAEGKRVQVVKI